LSNVQRRALPKVVVATSAMLSFISFWRASAIVLSDLASSAFYVGGIAEEAIGRSAPWFILGVMFFSFAVRSVYMESCSMYVRGGVYVVVRDAMGPFMARLSVSALIFDYILTGPISSVSAGQYLAGLLNTISEKLHVGYHINAAQLAMFFGLAVTAYFWRSNIRGVHESSGKALVIMQITTVMVVLYLVWCVITLLLHGPQQIPPAPIAQNIVFTDESAGWLKGSFLLNISAIAVVVAFGHSLLAMSGFETLAQVYREIETPKLKNLKLTGNIVCIFAVFSTGVLTVLAGMIIPNAAKAGEEYKNNLLGFLTQYLAGPEMLTLLFHAFVVVVGVLILSGAVNTSMIGANGVLNRVAEDHILTPWFRKPHKKYGTSFRLINLITLLQVGTILWSRGDVILLAEAYAFGVVWSFFLKALGVLVLRFKRKDQEYKTPFNITVGGKEIPIGLAVITITLLFVALANLFSKKVATISGVGFTLTMFLVFTISEKLNRKRLSGEKKGLEEFNLEVQAEVASESINARPACVLVAVRDYRHMDHLKSVLQKTNLRRHDIVVMTVRAVSTGAGEYELGQNQLFADYEKELFTAVVTMAEKEGKSVDLLVVPGVNPFDAMVHAATKLQASRLVTGVSAKMDSQELARRIGKAWEKLAEPRHPFSLEITSPDRPSTFVNLGPHPPRLWPEDVDLVHELWREISDQYAGSKVHHRDIVGVALRRMREQMKSPERDEVIADVLEEVSHHDKTGEKLKSP
jgi:amino acid transporter